jgi:hypothetical protein
MNNKNIITPPDFIISSGTRFAEFILKETEGLVLKELKDSPKPRLRRDFAYPRNVRPNNLYKGKK